MSKVMARSRRIAARRRGNRPAAGRPSPITSERPSPTTNGHPDVINPGIPGPAKTGHPAPADAGRFDPVATAYLDLMEPMNGDRRVGERRASGRGVGGRRVGDRRGGGRPSGHTGPSPRLNTTSVALALGAAGAVVLHLVLFGRAKRHSGF